MKKLLLASVFLISFRLIYSQDKLLETLPLNNGKVYYSGVVKVDSISASELYNRAKRWFINNYNSGKDVIQLDDKENFEIIGKGYYSDMWNVNSFASISVNVWQTIKIQCKDGRYRYEITDFRIKYHVPADQYTGAADIDMPIEEWGSARKNNAKKFYIKVDSKINNLIYDLWKSIKTQTKNDNW